MASGGTAVASSPKAFFERIAQSDRPWLSYSEELLWWAARLAGDTTFNVHVLLRLRGPVQPATLDRSIVELAKRHEALRTVFPMERGVVVRRLLPPESARPAIIDIEGIDPDCRDAHAQRLAIEAANRPFNVARGPLCRAQIVRLAPDDHRLQFTIHHLVIDGRSVDILLRELAMLYHAYAGGRPSPLPPLSAEYGSHVAEWKRQTRGRSFDRARAYWTTQLAGLPTLINLPTDGVRRPARYYRGHTLAFSVSAEQTRALQALARQHGVTMFVVLLSVLELLLYRLSGDRAIAIEAPLSNRRTVEADALIGLLVDLVILRGDIGPNARLVDLFAMSRRATHAAFDHAAVPIQLLVGALEAQVDVSHSVLAQVMFNLIDRRRRTAQLQAFGAELLPPPDSPHSKFDLMLTAHLTDALHFQLLYRRDLFSESRMRELTRQFQSLLDQALEDPGRCVDDYSLVAPRASVAPPAHDAVTFCVPPGSRIAVLPGASAVVRAHAEAAARGGSIADNWLDPDVTVVYGEPRQWRRLKRVRSRLPSLRYVCFVNGVLVREDVARARARWPAATCVYLFSAPDRADPYSWSVIPPETSELRTIVPVGCSGNAELMVVNRAGDRAGVGEIGEVCFSGANGVIATGLLGRPLPDGNVDRIGDNDCWGVVDGYTIRFDEIAATLMEHPAVLDARAGIDANGTIAATIVCDEDEPADAALEEFLRERLAAFMVLNRFVRATSDEYYS